METRGSWGLGVCRAAGLAAVISVVLAVPVQATVIFGDDFNTGAEPDPAKWTQVESAGCSVYLTGGALYASFIGAGAARYATATSPALDLPGGWTEIVLTGQWAFPTQGYGEAFIQVQDPDNTSVFVQASYVNWVGTNASKNWRGTYTGFGGEYVYRGSLPTALTDFTLTVTPTGWSFVTEGGSISKTYTTAHMAGLDKVQIRIGGWEHSAVTNVAAFDDIQLTPEPATLSLLVLGSVAMLARRRRRK